MICVNAEYIGMHHTCINHTHVLVFVDFARHRPASALGDAGTLQLMMAFTAVPVGLHGI